MEKWLSTLDTREAAAFATLGITVKIISTLHERTGRKVVRFLLSPANEDGRYHTGKLRISLQDGSLLKNEPAHPLVTILRAYHNREALLDLLKAGKFCRLVAVPGTPLWQYVPDATGLPGVQGGTPCLRTRDVDMVAALGIVGLPLLDIHGPDASRQFTVAAFGPPGVDGARLLAEWRRDELALPWEFPFTQAARGLSVRSLLRREVGAAIDTVIISKPKTLSHAILRADSSPAAWDKAKHFFSGI